MLQKETGTADLLKDSDASFHFLDHDNWDGGIDYWRLRLQVGLELFSTIEARLDQIQELILGKSKSLMRGEPRHGIAEVIIAPRTGGRVMLPLDVEVRHIWGDAPLRLFLSHVSAHKKEMADVKRMLGSYGVACFLAYEDIQPSKEWQQEIELALNSMHALCAYLTDDFHASDWTDQEVGWALGRGIPVLPIWVGSGPYGFMGKIQAKPVKGTWTVVDALVEMLLKHDRTHARMRSTLVEKFRTSDTWEGTRRLANLLSQVEDFPEEEKKMLWHALEHNEKVMDTWDARELIIGKIGKPPVENMSFEVDF